MKTHLLAEGIRSTLCGAPAVLFPYEKRNCSRDFEVTTCRKCLDARARKEASK